LNQGLYMYATTIDSIIVNGMFHVSVYARDKEYIVYPDKDGKWIEAEDGTRCKVFYFITDDRVMMVITQEECRKLYDDGWLLITRLVREEQK